MSFFYQKSVPSSRNHRTKEKESHPRASSLNPSGRHKTMNSKDHSNESPVPKSPVVQTLHHIQNDAPFDPQSASLSSDPMSADVSASASAQQAHHCHAGVVNVSTLPYTPLALQQYLELDSDDEQPKIPNADMDETSYPHEPRILVAATTFGVCNIGEALNNEDLTAVSNSSATFSEHQEDFSSQTDDFLHTADDRQASHASQYQHFHVMEQTESNNHTNQAGAASDFPASNQTVNQKSVKLRTHGSANTGVSTRRRPVSQIIGSSDGGKLAKTSPGSQPTMVRTTSHSSAPLLSRAFTPPPPPLNTSQASMAPSAAFISPVPLRSQPPAPYQHNYNTTAVPHHFQQPLQSMNHPYYHPFQVFNGRHQKEPATLWQYQQGYYQPMQQRYAGVPIQEQCGEDLVELLFKLQHALPEMQHIIHNSQQTAHGSKTSQDRATTIHASDEREGGYASIQQQQARYRETKVKHAEETAVLHSHIGELQAKVKHLESSMSKQQKSLDLLCEDLIALQKKPSQARKQSLEGKDDYIRRAEINHSADGDPAQIL